MVGRISGRHLLPPPHGEPLLTVIFFLYRQPASGMKSMSTQTTSTGYELLHNPRLNKGSAFTEAERRTHGLEGLLPPGIDSIELQIARIHAELANLDNDLQKYLLLSDL